DRGAVVDLRDVGLDRQRARSVRLDARRRVLEAVGAARAHDDVRARLPQALGEGDAEAGRRAGDDRDLAVEAELVEHAHGRKSQPHRRARRSAPGRRSYGDGMPEAAPRPRRDVLIAFSAMMLATLLAALDQTIV